MNKKIMAFLSVLMMASMVLSACASPTPAAPAPVQTVIVTQVVEVAGTPQVKEVVKEVVVTPTPAPKEKKLEIFHWWTAPGEREAADEMFKAFAAAYPDVKVVENPVPGGGGTEHRIVLKARITAGIPPDTFQTLGGAELKDYVDSNVLQPLDDFYKDYADKIPKPLLNAVTINGHPYSVPLNMHLENILYYNKKLFDELKLNAPTGYDDLLAACKAIKAAHPDMSCLAVGSKDNWSDVFVLDTIMMEDGGPEYYVKFFKGEIDVTTDPIFKKALEKYAALQAYSNMKDHSSLTWDQAVGAVGAGQAAMTIMGTWAIGAFIKGSNWQPGVDFGAVNYPTKPERILLFHPDTYGCTVGAPDPEECLNWLKVVSSPELQVPTDVTQGGMFARTDIDPKSFPDPIRQEMQEYLSKNPDKLILDQHGSILPNPAQVQYRVIISTFFADAKPDVPGTIKAVADMMTTFDVKTGAAWYQWP